MSQARAHWLHGEDNEETVVLVHGFNSSHATWDRLVERISSKYRTLVFDQPGHGLSPANGPDYSPLTLARRLKRLTDAVGAKAFHLVGHSMGGRTATSFAALYPDIVRSLVVEDMNLIALPEYERQLPALREKYVKVQASLPSTFASEAEAVSSLSRFYDSNEIAYILAAARARPDGTFQLGNRPEATMLYLAQGLAMDMSEALRSIRAPLAFFAADPAFSSTVLKGEGIAHIRKIRPDAMIRVFPGCGHSIHGRPEFAKALTTFLASIQNGGPSTDP